MIETCVLLSTTEKLPEILDYADDGLDVSQKLVEMWSSLNLHYRRVVLKRLSEENLLGFMILLPKREVEISFRILKQMDAPSWVNGLRITYLTYTELSLSLDSALSG